MLTVILVKFVEWLAKFIATKSFWQVYKYLFAWSSYLRRSNNENEQKKKTASYFEHLGCWQHMFRQSSAPYWGSTHYISGRRNSGRYPLYFWTEGVIPFHVLEDFSFTKMDCLHQALFWEAVVAHPSISDETTRIWGNIYFCWKDGDAHQ